MTKTFPALVLVGAMTAACAQGPRDFLGPSPDTVNVYRQEGEAIEKRYFLEARRNSSGDGLTLREQTRAPSDQPDVAGIGTGRVDTFDLLVRGDEIVEHRKSGDRTVLKLARSGTAKWVAKDQPSHRDAAGKLFRSDIACEAAAPAPLNVLGKQRDVVRVTCEQSMGPQQRHREEWIFAAGLGMVWSRDVFLGENMIPSPRLLTLTATHAAK